MSKSLFSRSFAAAALLAGATTLAGCFGPPYVQGSVGIEVGNGPPGYRSEVRIASPGSGYYWVPGYWDWNERDWFWVSGAWQRPPRAGAIWVGPHYRHNRGHWQYYRGYWR